MSVECINMCFNGSYTNYEVTYGFLYDLHKGIRNAKETLKASVQIYISN
jgi:hypothetical protein